MDSQIFTILSSGIFAILGSLITWIGASKIEKSHRRHEFLSNQLKFVYGPLYFCVVQYGYLCNIGRKVGDKIDEMGEEHKNNADKKFTAKVKDSIDIMNHYESRIPKQNNEYIYNILKKNYAYVDKDDVNIFHDFAINHLRMKKECSKERVNYEIYKYLGDIPFMKEEFAERVRKKFFEKTEKLNPPSCFSRLVARFKEWKKSFPCI